jgi:predicted lactoylglutathione lyase
MSEPGADARPDHQEDRVATPNFVILYVDNPVSSAAFYARLLDRPALETSPTFAMFSLHDGVMLGLWSRHTVQPGASATAGAAEIAFTADSKEAVQNLHTDWKSKGLPVLQPPTQMDFGFTFTAADPDGHRLRVFVPAAA